MRAVVILINNLRNKNTGFYQFNNASNPVKTLNPLLKISILGPNNTINTWKPLSLPSFFSVTFSSH